MIEVYFSPGPTAAIVRELGKAATTIHVRAYGFTSVAIGDALIAAHKRGVVVDMVVDPCNSSRYSQAPRCIAAGISVMTDHKHAISHDKIMVIDKAIVLTGSFNFTESAEKHNAENMVILRDTVLAEAYIRDHLIHRLHSTEGMLFDYVEASSEELESYDRRMGW